MFAFCFGGVGLCQSSCNVQTMQWVATARVQGDSMDSCGNQVSELARCLLLAMGTIEGTHTHTHNYLFPAPLFQCLDGDSDAGSLLLMWGDCIEVNCLLLVSV